MFMNRFRNLQLYFDEEIYEYISVLNNNKSACIKLKENEYKLAFIVIDLNDLGGAQFP